MTCDDCECNDYAFCDKYGFLITESDKQYDCWENGCRLTEENSLKQ